MKKFDRLVEEVYANMYITEDSNFEEETQEFKSTLEDWGFKVMRGKDCLIKMKYKRIKIELFEQDGKLYFYIEGKGNGISVEEDGDYNIRVIEKYLEDLV